MKITQFNKFCENNPDLERGIKEIMDSHLMEINDERSRKKIADEINDYVRKLGGDLTLYKFIVLADVSNPTSITARPILVSEPHHVEVNACIN